MERRRRLPEWFRRPLAAGGGLHTAGVLGRHGVESVCREARCPNRGECFAAGTATFLILGTACTRACRFCAIGHAERPAAPDPGEPERVAAATREMGLRYVVVTSVTRDDLPDGGAGHFAATVRALREAIPGVKVELLIPDLQGDERALATVFESRPDVLNHNVETTAALQAAVRPQADYGRSLGVLRAAAAAGLVAKSGLMLGLGETEGDVARTLEDLRAAGVRLLTLGQYLPPSERHYPLARHIPPEEFKAWRERALAMGFEGVASGPMVRSSYRAAMMCGGGENPPHGV